MKLIYGKVGLVLIDKFYWKLKVCYSEKLLMVLYGVICIFWGGKKVGVVGWIGSGKLILI